jgi:hypothetical protein
VRRSLPRRFLALVVALPAVVTLLGGSALPTQRAVVAQRFTVEAVAPAAVAEKVSFADSAAAEAGRYDAHLGPRGCGLLGRTYDATRGCSRDACVAGAVPGNRNVGAEVCRLRGGHVYATSVGATTCRSLGRVWIEPVNACASNPDRARTLVAHAPQCAGRRSTYVTHTEREGRYDECLTPSAVHALRVLAARRHTTVEGLAAQRSPVLCAQRPRHAMRDGVCRLERDQPLATGGVLLVGDSIAWRGADELARLRPGWTVDGDPGRRLVALPSRLHRYAAGHQAPTGLVLELGTNHSPGYAYADLVRDVAALPAGTRLMLVAPYRSGDPGRAATAQVARWMRTLAASRPDTCVADWRRLALDHLGSLVDGVHPTSDNEASWASWVATRWDRCAA